MSRIDPSNEPARKTPYRRLYVHIYKLKEEVARQDGVNGYLLSEIRSLQKRMAVLEKRNDNLANAALRLACGNVEAIRELEQCGDLQPGERGDQAAGHPAAGDGR